MYGDRHEAVRSADRQFKAPSLNSNACVQKNGDQQVGSISGLMLGNVTQVGIQKSHSAGLGGILRSNLHEVNKKFNFLSFRTRL